MRTAILGLMLAVIAPVAAEAQVPALETDGTVVYTTTNRQTRLGEGRRLTAIVQKGIIKDKREASPLHLSAQDCVGTLYTAEGETPFGAGICTTIDHDRDLWWLSWTSDGERAGEWVAIDGTGKYRGLSGGGTIRVILNMKDRTALEYTGSLTLKPRPRRPSSAAETSSPPPDTDNDERRH
ncbi:hypothetical protein L0F51_06795 [Afifella sp. H1R]|uniref:hypothetical protein n=1 Tax=Afifella sp. H1R TaxID=2908841 RepID=UPI001F349B6F|nr:hypothetical protein [Afifella sp. H1R]MCF1503465.1 hypothetical protein [Afifella sp. H1R]